MIKPLFLLIVAMALLNLSYGQKVRKIKQKRVARILKTLSSDEMEGRRTFTAGIDKAADFIAQEFKAIGLQYLEGLSEYQQRFQLFELTTDSLSIELNGKSVAAENCFAIASDRKLAWKTGDDIHVVHIKAEDDLRTAIRPLMRAKNNQLIVIDQAHSNMFGRFQRFLSRANRSFELGKEPSSIFVLSSEEEVVDFEITASMNVNKLPLANVAGMIQGKRKDEIVMFSGHYDHLGIGKAVEGDSIYNGANDDASGITAVISLARYFSKRPQPERSLIFVAFTAEEIGGYGSRYFSNQFEPEKIIAMFNIEMIGVIAEKGPSTAYITGFDKSDFGTILQSAVSGMKYEFIPDPYPAQNLFYRSDNATLARLGVPAHTLSSTPMTSGPSHYHQPSDEFDTLDLSHITDIIRGIALGAHNIISGSATPLRVDPAQVD